MAIQGGSPEQQTSVSKGPIQPVLKTPAEIAHLKGEYEAIQEEITGAQTLLHAASGGADPRSAEYQVVQRRMSAGESLDMIRGKSAVNYNGLMIKQLDAQAVYHQAQADLYAGEGVIPGTDAQVISLIDKISNRKAIRLDDPLYSWSQAQVSRGKTWDQLRSEAQTRISQEQSVRDTLHTLRQKREGKSRIKGLYHKIRGTDARINRLEREVEAYDASHQRRREYAEILHALKLIPGQRESFISYREQALERVRQIQLADVRRQVREQTLQQIRLADYSGYAPGPDVSAQPAYIPPETVFPSNQEAVALIPLNSLQEIVRELGKGMTGSSRLVRITGLGPPLVLKESGLSIQEGYELSQEAEALQLFRKLGINTVPRLEGVGTESSPLRVYMEYIQGETIAQLAQRTAALPLDGVTKVNNMNWEMAYMCIQLIHTLAKIHGAGMIHNDLANKPDHLIWANVTLPDGTIRRQLKIIDFGNVVHPDAIGDVSPKTYIHDVADAFGVILKHAFHLPIYEERGLNSIDEWESEILATGHQGLIRVAAKLKSYKDAQAFSADMMPIFDQMIP